MKNKKSIAIALILATCISTFYMGTKVGASNNEPGSVGDPLITESYLEKRLEEVNGSSTSTSSSYKKVTVESGKVITLTEGSTTVVYSGSGTITSGGELINLATSELFVSGNSTVKYASMLAVKNNVGIKATGSMVVYVSGSYKIG